MVFKGRPLHACLSDRAERTDRPGITAMCTKVYRPGMGTATDNPFMGVYFAAGKFAHESMRPPSLFRVNDNLSALVNSLLATLSHLSTLLRDLQSP